PSLLRNADLLGAHLDTHSIEAAQKSDECVGIIDGEHTADLKIAQPRRGDLDRLGGVAVEFADDLSQRLVLEADLAVQPCGAALGIHRYGCDRPVAGVDGDLLIGADLYK